MGNPVYERVVLAAPAGFSGPPKDIKTSCDCAQVLAHRGVPGQPTGLEVLLKVAPHRKGQFSYDIWAEYEGGGRLETYLNVVAVPPDGSTTTPGPTPAAPSLTDQVESGSAIFDVRPMERFARAHLAGSIPIARHDLRRAIRQAGTGVVVVGDGHDDEQLLAELATHSRAREAPVKLLAGGVRGWRARGGALEGSATEGAAMLALRAGEVLPWLGDPRVAWLASRRPAASPSAAEPAAAVFLPAVEAGRSPDPGDRLRELAAAQPPPRRVLLAMDEGAEDLLLRALTEHPHLPVFAVQGGVAALQAEAAFLLRMQSRTTVTRAGGHGQDPVRGSGRRSGGGCCGK